MCYIHVTLTVAANFKIDSMRLGLWTGEMVTFILYEFVVILKLSRVDHMSLLSSDTSSAGVSFVIEICYKIIIKIVSRRFPFGPHLQNSMLPIRVILFSWKIIHQFFIFSLCVYLAIDFECFTFGNIWIDFLRLNLIANTSANTSIRSIRSEFVIQYRLRRKSSEMISVSVL